ncbi:putative membrane protein [Azospirillum brasilense]|uniref:Putative membrane protein n=1 Tax=Azospirillum brasilense TaxID=192 RepID=A0A560CPA3_AZOBR|nr:SRPBCC family protein [Azospirillum brasilense]TWA86683.1 putative membrane protein [Azospirillum brasilense]
MSRGRDGGWRPEGSAGTLERWAAILGGTALGFAGARRGSWALAALGGGLFLAGAAGVPLSSPLRPIALPAMRREPTTTQANVTIAVPAEKLFRHWRNVRHLSALFPHLDAVEILSDTESRWKAHGPGGVPVVWNSRIDKVRENELITWHTLEGADLPHRGTVLFRPAPGGRGTEVSLTLAYHPPGGAGGDAVSRLFGVAPERQAREALRRLKRLMEVGALPTIDGQPSGRGESRSQIQEVTG